jgi:shikimate kinase/3-dehydroquinate synthase
MPFNRQTPGFKINRSIVLIGLMGAGKTAIGKRLAAHLGLQFYDADQEIEQAAGISVNEIFARHGEAHFRTGEKRVIQRLLEKGPIVLAPGGGAYLDPETRALIRERATSVWLRCALPILLARVSGRTHRPLLNKGNPADILARLAAERNPLYAQADLIVDGSEGPPEVTMHAVVSALKNHTPPAKVTVQLAARSYDVLIGAGLLARAGAFIAPVLPQKRCIIITDEIVAPLHLATLTQSLDEVGVAHSSVIVPPGEASKSLERWSHVVNALLYQKADRGTAIIALGGGVVGDLSGFAAAATLRGLPFIQIPTTVLAQVDSSVGGKTGINARQGKNLIGAFHQPLLVLADTGVIATLPIRERRAGYAEIVKAGLIADKALYKWCEANGLALLEGDATKLAYAVEQAVKLKAAVVGDDEREEKPNNGRALLNLGHTFGHALEAETGFGKGLLHGEAVAIGLVLAARLSALLGFLPDNLPSRIAAHLAETGLPHRIPDLPADRLLAHMKQDKKMRDGKLTFILLRGIGEAFTDREVPEDLVRQTLLDFGAV